MLPAGLQFSACLKIWRSPLRVKSVLLRQRFFEVKMPALAPAPGLRLGRRGAKGASAAGQGLKSKSLNHFDFNYFGFLVPACPGYVYQSNVLVLQLCLEISVQ
jgi:hypothetical protein